MSLEFKLFEGKEKIAEKISITELCFPELKGTFALTEPFYAAKFHGTQFNKKAYEYVAYENDKLLGYYAAIPKRYWIDDKTWNVGFVCDVMTHPEARGKGVFTKVGRFATDHLKDQSFAFTTGFVIRPEVIPGHLKVGWKIMLELPIYLNVINLQAFLRRRKIGFLWPFVAPFVMIANYFFDLLAPRRYRVEKSELDLATMADFFARVRRQWPIVQDRDEENLRWRLQKELGEYGLLKIYDRQANVQGYVIYRPFVMDGLKTLAIVDWLFAPDHEAASRSACRWLRRYARQNDLGALSLLFNPTYYCRYKLWLAGLIPTPVRFKFITKLFVETVNTGRFYSKDWYLTWFDVDHC